MKKNEPHRRKAASRTPTGKQATRSVSKREG